MYAANTKALLRQARKRGADRLYGRPKQFGEHNEYILEAVDGNGKVYFHRAVLWATYLEAVTYWQTLDTPGVTVLPEGELEAA